MSRSAVVTVVVPGYEVAPYAREALDSLRAQTLAEWTAVLVDDASTDGTADIFAEAAAADPRFRLVRHETRRGLGAARNTGLDAVGTPFLGFLDADDVLRPDALERMVSTLDASGSDFVVGAYVRLRPDGAGGYAAGEVQPWVRAATDPARTGTTIDEHPQASGNIVAWSKVSRTAFWQQTGLRFPEGRLYEDQVVAQRMYTRARRFDVLPDVVVHWRERAEGTSITQYEARLDVLRDCLAAMADGLAVLDAAGHGRAASARVSLILAMDLPRLARIAADHPDPAHRRAVGAFARSLTDRPDAGALRPDPLLSAALLW
ncbi:glycosyltransferase family 2 protein [Microbacterium sp. GXF7504]